MSSNNGGEDPVTGKKSKEEESYESGDIAIYSVATGLGVLVLCSIAFGIYYKK